MRSVAVDSAGCHRTRASRRGSYQLPTLGRCTLAMHLPVPWLASCDRGSSEPRRGPMLLSSSAPASWNGPGHSAARPGEELGGCWGFKFQSRRPNFRLSPLADTGAPALPALRLARGLPGDLQAQKGTSVAYNPAPCLLRATLFPAYAASDASPGDPGHRTSWTLGWAWALRVDGAGGAL